MTARLRVGGTVRVPGDKSISHRALLLAAAGDGISRLTGVLHSADVEATARALRALGVDLPPLAPVMSVSGRGLGGLRTPTHPLNCGNSGTTARLLAGMVAGQAALVARFDGDASLRRRPMMRIAAPLRAMGAAVAFDGGDGQAVLPLQVAGAALSPVAWRSDQASAQVKGAVLLAALVAGVDVTLTEPGHSRDHTERMLAARGVRVDLLPDGVRLAAAQRVGAADQVVPGDPSSAAMFAALAVLADDGEVRLEDVCLNPTRTGAFDVLRRMGADLHVENRHLVGGEPVGTLVVRPSPLTGTVVRGDDIPRCIDELPMLACVAACANGTTLIADAAELRVKESDRISAVVSNLHSLGVEAEERPDGLVVHGRPDAGRAHRLAGRVRTYGDHRVAMAFGVLGALPNSMVAIDDPACVTVSFSAFWELLAAVQRGGGPGQSGRVAASGRSAMPAPLVIAIDGPAASGKSSTAQWVASRLGVRHVDSGAFYRALTALALETGMPPERWTDAIVLASAGRISRGLTDRSVLPLIDGASGDDRLRAAEVTAQVSRVASMPAVRDWVNGQVRAAGADTDVVVDGRDIGTTVFPEAALKVFLVADPWERARRRMRQRLQRGPTDEEIAAETEALVQRDARDATQSAPARDAVTIDTTTLSQEEQVERIVSLARAVRGRSGSIDQGAPSA